MSERWADILSYKGYYQASTLGSIRSIGRIIYEKNGKKRSQQSVTLKQTKNSRGYLWVALSKSGKVRQFRVHRLVAETFLKRQKLKTVVNHKNGDQLDNTIQNLEWCTQKENIRHASSMGRVRSGEQCNLSKLSIQQVLVIRKLRKSGTRMSVIIEMFKIDKTTAYDIVANRSWRNL